MQDVADWWATAVSRVEPDVIELRGRPVQELIGTTSFVGVIWLLLRGDAPTPGQERLLEAALVSSVDHGPHAPSIAVARMAITCGIGLNNAIASGVNTLGDVHGGAGEQCMEMLAEVTGAADGDATSTTRRLRSSTSGGPGAKYLPGFGHRFHTTDPRRDPLLGLVREAVADGVVDGAYLRAAEAVERRLPSAGGRTGTDQCGRLHRRRLRRAGLRATTGPWPVRAEPQRRHPRPRLGGGRPGPAQQGSDAPVDPPTHLGPPDRVSTDSVRVAPSGPGPARHPAASPGPVTLCYLTTRTVAVDVSCFCSPSCRKFATSVNGTASPSGTLLSRSALSNATITVRPIAPAPARP